MKGFYSILTSCIIILTSFSTVGETLWTSNSISYLKNLSDFEVLTNDKINVFTFEHASGHNWGDVFVFADRIDASKDSNNPAHKETYGEFNARLSLDYALGLRIDNSLIKDSYLASTWEFSTVSKPEFSNGFDNYLLGVGIGWNFPAFKFFNTNLYIANNEQKDNDTQLTVNWSYPVSTGKHKISFDGYIDWSSTADDHAADFHFNPQLRLDVGNYYDMPNKIEVGFEYSYWHNKFGIANLDSESVFSAMIKVYL